MLELLPPAAQARLLLERTPFPVQPTFPYLADRVATQFSSVPRPSEIGCRFDLRDLAITVVFAHLHLVLRGGHTGGLIDSCMPPAITRPPRFVRRSVPRLVALEHQVIRPRGALRGGSCSCREICVLMLDGLELSTSTIPQTVFFKTSI